MMWAKAEKKRSAYSSRVMLAAYTAALCLLSVAAFAQEALTYRVTQAEAEALISQALMDEGHGEALQVSIVGRRAGELIQRNEPIIMEIAELTPDTASNRFTATLSFSTEAALNKPAARLGNLQVAGRFDAMEEIPVLKFRVSSGVVIKEEDIIWQKMPSTRLDRGTVLSADDIIGKTPTRAISAGRAIKSADLRVPPVVLRQSTVHMNYKSPHIVIQAVGMALEDGAVGDRIRVRNTSSGNVLEGVVTASGQVQVIPAPHVTRVNMAQTAALPALHEVN